MYVKELIDGVNYGVIDTKHRIKRLTWKCRMMVQIRPRVSLGFPSTMSSARMFTTLIFLKWRKLRVIWTFCSMWKRIRPFSRGCGEQNGWEFKKIVRPGWQYSTINILWKGLLERKYLGRWTVCSVTKRHRNIICKQRYRTIVKWNLRDGIMD